MKRAREGCVDGAYFLYQFDLAEQFSRGGGLPSDPRALACLVPRDSELAFLLRSVIKRSPPPPSPN